MSFRTLVRNALAHATRVGVSAVAALLLPAVLVRVLSESTYGVWALILQLSAYVAFLDFGVQTAIGRFVANAAELDDRPYRNRIVSTALSFLIGSAILGIGVIAGLSWLLPTLFQDIPTVLQHDAQLALGVVGMSLALGLPASAFIGIFVGLQRSEVPVSILVGSKVVSSLLLVAVANLGGGLVAMSLVVAGVNGISYLLQYLACRILVPDLRFSPRLITPPIARELGAYCLSLSIWTLGAFLVSGLDLTIVGYFAFDSVQYYAIAIALTTFVIQMQGAIFSVLIPAGAALDAQADRRQLGTLLLRATRYGTILLVLMGLPLVFGARQLLTIWVGPLYAANTERILQILVIANLVRLLALPYSNLLVATNQQHLVVISPLLEGGVNLVVSIAATLVWGAMGAAIGTLVGAFVSVGFHIVYNMPRTRSIAIGRRALLSEGIARPLMCAVPGVIFALLFTWGSALDLMVSSVVVAIAFVLTVVVIWRFGLIPDERQRMAIMFQRA